ncbi:MAG TPA: hypothetical protein VGM17_13930 [Rhizomicrobium sp.]
MRKPQRIHQPPQRSHLDWAVRARTTMLDAQRYTRFVTIMKRALLLAAGALLLAVLAYSLQPRDAGRYAMTFQSMGRIANDLTMVHPRLSGTDGDGNPFVVTAETAVQDEHHLHRARLMDVEGDFTAKDHAWYTLAAPRGLLDSDAQKLWLEGNIALYSDSGYELHTKSAFVDLAAACDPVTGKAPSAKPGRPAPRCTKTAVRGDQTVVGHGPVGKLRADRFHIEKATRRIFFAGHVAMRIYPAQARNGSKKT